MTPGMTSGMTRALLALLALTTLAACGRAGPPRVPGPKEQVTYPHTYPQYAPLPKPDPATATAPASQPGRRTP
jgi:predicted small lipoprotein YifL